MDRLIKRIGHGIVMSKSMQLAMERLASYEDTGLEPDEIPHWIPVSERLPKESEYRNGNRYKFMDSNELVPLLVCCKDTEIPFRAFYDGKNWGDGWSKVDVICWMPLPAVL